MHSATDILTFNIGSKNPVKVEAVKQVIQSSPLFEHAAFQPVAADSGVSSQPIGLEETVHGAVNRAVNAFDSCHFSIGLESGMIPVPGTTSGYMNLTACVIFDGSDQYTGLGPAFELPADVTRLVVEDHLELDEAVQAAGLTDHPRIGYAQGIIGILTRGQVTRMDYSKPAVSMALTRLYAKIG